MPTVKDKREYALTPEDRSFEIARKFGSVDGPRATVTEPTGQVLAAIVFLARPGHVEDIESNVVFANSDRARLLNAATVKEERG
ncbi:hypothetical protein [Montanilutibacter psychrotolerans]|uniref:Uncharacterized protein n=1 Tax=Montanilutibacter psychrotolerans TaxID=1327343 RepID=A0A3M8SX67_9GAMM|nr:hypothetical protein [Lysobacter psychrotolerans]RNF85275.1 hypothetical protein EER27_05795 [Lysobacter psychrotolerans]